MGGPKMMPGPLAALVAGPLAAGGLAVIRIRLLPDAGSPGDALLPVNCAKGKVPEEEQSDGIRLTITGGPVFDEQVSRAHRLPAAEAGAELRLEAGSGAKGTTESRAASWGSLLSRMLSLVIKRGDSSNHRLVSNFRPSSLGPYRRRSTVLILTAPKQSAWKWLISCPALTGQRPPARFHPSLEYSSTGAGCCYASDPRYQADALLLQ